MFNYSSSETLFVAGDREQKPWREGGGNWKKKGGKKEKDERNLLDLAKI